MWVQTQERKKFKIVYKMTSWKEWHMKIEQLYVWLSEIASCKAKISYSVHTHDSEGSCCVEFCDSVPNLDVGEIRVLRKLNTCLFLSTCPHMFLVSAWRNQICSLGERHGWKVSKWTWVFNFQTSCQQFDTARGC